MSKIWKHIFILFCSLGFLWSHQGQSVSLRPTALSGFMQQPASQYYHLVYGGQLDLSNPHDLGFVRLQMIERPVFRSEGYSDQDLAANLLFGRSVYEDGRLGLSALIGGGLVWGYVQQDQTNQPVRESYRMNGLTVGMEGRLDLNLVEFRLSHQTMVCQNSKDQLQAYVVWPFSWYLITLSAPISWGS